MIKLLHFFLWFIICFPSAVMANKLVTLHIGEWPPYTSADQTKSNLAEELVREAFESQDYRVNFEFYPWKRSYKNVQDGVGDGTFPWYSTEQRAKDFIISKEAIFKERVVFFHLKSNEFDWNSFDDLKRYRIGGIIGYNNVDILEKQGVRVFVVSEENFVFKMLLAGRIDAYPTAEIVGYEFMNNLFSPEEVALFTSHSKTLNEGDLHMLFSKNMANAQELSDTFDKGLVFLKKSGRYDEIMQKFLK